MTLSQKSLISIFKNMSHPYGRGSYPRSGRSGYSNYEQHRDRDGYGGNTGEHSGYEEFQGRGRGKGRGHPPGLKGREIGLYYRDKAKKQNSHRDSHRDYLDINLNANTEEDIRLMLRRIERSKQNEDSNYTNEKNGDLKDKYTHINDSHFKRKFLEIVSGNIQQNLAKSMLLESKLERNNSLNQEYLEEFKIKQRSAEYKTMLKFREKLPSFQKRQEILDLVRDNQVIVISGETGCGKTTQIAQFILDDEIEKGNASITKIICTQPRRISAISVAERVAAERAENLGNSVGFQIRLEKVPARDSGSILFCTTGLMLQFMQSDPALRNYSHIILDEIHERNTDSDFIITLLKQIIPKRPDLKIILMSATLNSDQFSKYYNNCPNIHIPGFTYPVQEFFLEDVLQITRFEFPEIGPALTGYRKYIKKHKKERQKFDDFCDFIEPYVRHLESEKKYSDFVLKQLRNPRSEELSLDLVEILTKHICTSKPPGAILIFLPGIMDISKLHKIMVTSGKYPPGNYIIYPLHSRMPTVDQKIIFQKPPSGVRKIIIATSIAETSITIEDVVYVIDCGKMKLTNFDLENNILTLEPEWVSLANAKQRKGRAGRVQSGTCYHLYSKARELTFDQYPLPEMLRTRLEEVILQAKILQLGKIQSFLAGVIDPPDPKAVELSLDLLRKLEALDSDENLTPLGYHLAQLPLDPRTGKMIIWGALFSCVTPVFAIAASLTFKDAFYCPLGKEDEAREKKLKLGLDQYSDHVALAEALRRFEQGQKWRGSNSYCREYFLSGNTLKLLSDMKRQFALHLSEMKFLDSGDPNDQRSNRNSNNLALVKAIVCAGLYPNIARTKSSGHHHHHHKTARNHSVKIWTPEDGPVKLHPSSINDKGGPFPSPYMTYFTKQRSTAIFLHDTTCISPIALLLSAPINSINEEKGYCVITVSNFLKFKCQPGSADIIQKLRKKLDFLLEYKIAHPGTVRWDHSEGAVLSAIIELITEADEEMGLKCRDIMTKKEHRKKN
ncbi:ATP-dependent RNA helicase DHX36 isoform X2 [Cephus cinctus]|uniref:RNA helicase n=1 Tax=Cephus cinctus TaxID=211228 RepID=A0AAJ7C4M7_CEPCN|nr:ATP-dependent RNA helicase DHX36 isoform X2 [Cephus cinctus]